MKSLMVALGVFGAICCCLVGPAQADLVINGGFELPPIAGSFGTITPPPQSLYGWTVTGSVDLIHDYWTPDEPTQSLDLDGNFPGAISQSLATVPGQWYVLSFAYSNNPDGHPTVYFPPSATVTVGTLTLVITDADTTNTRSDMHWIHYSGLFQATADSTLTFASNDSGPYGIALDAISVTAAVPEAGSLTVWSLLGLSLVGWSQRRKK